jgi:hypothetical protein
MMKVGDRVRVIASNDRRDGRVGVVRHILVAVQLDGTAIDELSWFEANALAAVVERRRRGDGTVYEYPKGSGCWWAKVPTGHGGDIRRRAKSRAEAERKLTQLQKLRRAREE